MMNIWKLLDHDGKVKLQRKKELNTLEKSVLSKMLMKMIAIQMNVFLLIASMELGLFLYMK